VSDDWLEDDPFADPDDPAAREREQRRLEREERRRGRESKRDEQGATAPPPPPPAPEPAPAPRTPEEEFWDDEPAAEERPAHEPVAEEPVAARPIRAEAAPEQPIASEQRAARAPVIQRVRGGGGRGGDSMLRRLGRHPFRIVAILVALFLLWSLYALFQPFHGDGSGRVQLTIPKGSSVSEVADLLDEKGVIDNSTLFQVRVTIAGKRSDLFAGHFTLAHGMSYGAAIDALSTPPVKRTTTVTIPEGYTRSQAAQLVSEDGVPGSYNKATVNSKYLNPAQYGAKSAKNLEGFLFPDTFEMKPNAPVGDLVQLQLQDFKRRIKGVDMSYARSKNLTVYDVLIIASMIEREAGVPGQRKLVASVIYNRLKEGRPLGIDATTRFATGNYAKPLTESELAINSPYNTRENVGLPPGPINSPGLEAIEAAAHPAKTSFIFYVTEPGACGKLAFSSTEAEWERDVQRYESAREAAGGNSPDTCGE
jgi:UPF0755 protein